MAHQAIREGPLRTKPAPRRLLARPEQARSGNGKGRKRPGAINSGPKKASEIKSNPSELRERQRMRAQHAFLVDLWANDPRAFLLGTHRWRGLRSLAALQQNSVPRPFTPRASRFRKLQELPQARNRGVHTLGGVCALLKNSERYTHLMAGKSCASGNSGRGAP